MHARDFFYQEQQAKVQARIVQKFQLAFYCADKENWIYEK